MDLSIPFFSQPQFPFFFIFPHLVQISFYVFQTLQVFSLLFLTAHPLIYFHIFFSNFDAFGIIYSDYILCSILVIEHICIYIKSPSLYSIIVLQTRNYIICSSCLCFRTENTYLILDKKSLLHG